MIITEAERQRRERQSSLDRAGWRPKRWCREADIGRTKMYSEIQAGRIKTVKCGRATIIVTSPREYLISLA